MQLDRARLARLSLALLPLALSALGSTPGARSAADLYVDVNGAGCASATGGVSDPYCSLVQAVAAASAGDTIHIAPGTYDESIVVDKDLSLIGTAGQSQTILRGLSGAPTVASDPQTAPMLELRELTITHAAGQSGEGVRFRYLGTLTMEDCTVRDNAGTGVNVEGQNDGPTLHMRRCLIENNQDTGIEVFYAGATIEDSTVRANFSPFRGGGLRGIHDYKLGIFTVQLDQCVIEDNSAALDGGALHSGSMLFDLSDCVVRDNTAAGIGGAVSLSSEYYVGGSVIAENCQFTGNQATSGGAFGSGGTVNLTNCVVEGNSATNDGGAVYCYRTFRATRTILRDNHAQDDGGAIYALEHTEADLSEIELFDCLIESNTAGDDGGGISMQIEVDWPTNRIFLTRCTLRGNAAGGDGGGIHTRMDFPKPRVFVDNSTVSNNSATRGGGMFIEGVLAPIRIARLRQVTVTDNEASFIGGGLSSCYSDGVDCAPAALPVVQAVNSIVAGNSAPQSLDLTGLFESLGGNLIGVRKGGNGFSDGVLGDQVGELEDPLDPGLGPLADNGGFTPTHALLAGSPALDAADPAFGNCLPTDQREVPRPFGAGCDVGAYEFDSTAALVAFGQGVAGSGGFVPQLSGLGSPVPGGSFTLSIEDGLGGGVGALLLGAELAPPLPLFGGSLYASSLLSFPSLLSGVPGTPGAGEGAQAVLVPNVPALVGSSFAAQAGHFDSGAAQGIALSNAVRVTIGL